MKLKTRHILFLIFYISCGQSADEYNINNPRIKDAFENRKKQFIEENMKNCNDDLLQKAEIYVDSLIAAEIDYRLNDSIIFPEKPVRPDWPGEIVVPDSIKAKPIFK